MTQIFIMCQGKGSRWKEGQRNNIDLPSEYKQLIPIGNEPNLFRTIRLLEALGCSDEIFIVANVSMFGENAFLPIINRHTIITLQEPTQSIINGMNETRRIVGWDTDVAFLLGDVVYSKKSLETLLSNTVKNLNSIYVQARFKPNSVTGKQAPEIHGLRSVNSTLYNENYGLLSKYVPPKLQELKLWDLVICDSVKEVPNIVVGVSPPDYTDDIDSPEEYAQYGEIIIREALKE